MVLGEPPRTAWDVKLALLRVPVRVHPAFWLVALLLGYHKDLPLNFVLANAAYVLAAILVHEFGHALSGRHYGDRENHVVLYWLGGLTIPGGEIPGRWQRVWHALWGPLAGFLFAGLALGARAALARGWLGAPRPLLDAALEFLFWANLLWGVMNLMPVLPLDGGQVLRELVRWKSRRGDSFVLGLSAIAALVVAGAALVLYVYQLCDLFPLLLFLALAFENWRWRRQALQYGGLGEYNEPRQPWEQDADWWKR